MTPIQQKLCVGDRRSVGCAREVAGAVLDTPHLLPEIMDGLQSNDPVLRSRCAHVIGFVAQEEPTLLEPFKDVILYECAPIPQWEVRDQMSKVIPKLALTRADTAHAYRLFETYLQDRSSIVRTCAMQAMVDLLPLAPERKVDVHARIQTLTQTGTAAMRARGRMLLVTLEN